MQQVLLLLVVHQLCCLLVPLTSAARLLLVTTAGETENNSRTIRAKLTVPSKVPCMLPDGMARCGVSNVLRHDLLFQRFKPAL
jgi:hypothetical protein